MAKKRSANSLPASKPVLVLDAGTTGIKAFVFKGDNVFGRAYLPLKKVVKIKNGLKHVEQDPAELVKVSKAAMRRALKISGRKAKDLAGFGLTTQRETFIFWDKRNGRPLYPAVVWEDERTKRQAARFNARYGREILQKTGLPVIPYFSATKTKWVLDNNPALKKKVAGGDAIWGTVDSWLLWNFGKHHPHITDYTNASRTLLFNIRTLKWDDELLSIFDVPQSILPEAKPTWGRFGRMDKNILGTEIPILAVCGDQQASLFAAGLARGSAKITYGTGAFLAESLSGRFQLKKPFFTTLAPSSAEPCYMLEAKVNDCGARIAPLIGHEELMRKETTKIARAVTVYIKKLPVRPNRIVLDGGVTQYEPLIEIQSRLSGIPAVRQVIYDGTALGAARLVYKALEYATPSRAGSRKRWKREFSAGGVVFRPGKKEPEILLIEPSYKDRKNQWTFPKGWTSDHGGETTEETALREVHEEGGVNAKIVHDLGDIHYVFVWQGINISKTVHHYLMRYKSGNVKDHDFEVSEARWVPLSQAKKMLRFHADKEVFERARKILTPGS